MSEQTFDKFVENTFLYFLGKCEIYSGTSQSRWGLISVASTVSLSVIAIGISFVCGG